MQHIWRQFYHVKFGRVKGKIANNCEVLPTSHTSQFSENGMLRLARHGAACYTLIRRHYLLTRDCPADSGKL